MSHPRTGRKPEPQKRRAWNQQQPNGRYRPAERGDYATHREFALAHPHRRSILQTVTRHPGVTRTELATHLNVNPSTIAMHARHLQRANLIHTENAGRHVRHYPTKETTRIEPTSQWGTEIIHKAMQEDTP